MNRKLAAIALSCVGLIASGAVMAASNLPLGIPKNNSATATMPSDKRPVITPTSIGFGAYDPYGDFGSDSSHFVIAVTTPPLPGGGNFPVASPVGVARHCRRYKKEMDR